MALRLASDSPLTPDMTSVEVTSIKGMSNSDAIAWAKLVFPLPVGPKIKSPLKSLAVKSILWSFYSKPFIKLWMLQGALNVAFDFANNFFNPRKGGKL